MGFRTRHNIADLGVGVGARSVHYDTIVKTRPAMDWFEIISENFLVDGGPPRAQLANLAANYRLIPHGVSMAIGSDEPCSADYLVRLQALVSQLNPPWFSDHLCWGRVDGLDLHDLLPLPMTKNVVHHVVEKIRRIQDLFGRPFAIENVSSYLTYKESEMPEWAFVSEIAEAADCGLLFDVNNVFVNAYNHGLNAETYIDSIPHDRVVQIHLAGHSDEGSYLLDTHAAPVCDPVWALYRRTLERTGPVSTLIEWDEDVPAWETLSAEAERARAVKLEVALRSIATEKHTSPGRPS
jgi:uncharacterized protein